MKKENGYNVFDYDNLTHGSRLKVEHTVYAPGDPDISELVSKPLRNVEAMRKRSVKAEDEAFERIKTAFEGWEKHAAVTNKLDRAIAYLKVPDVEHTSNKWQKDKYGNFDCISNMVYKMIYRFYEYSSYRTGREKKRCEVGWDLYVNSPRVGFCIRIAGQQKSYPTRAEAEKYMAGRIKAYSHLFIEICPVVPKEYADSFMLYGQVLRGYTIEDMEPETEKSDIAEKPDKKPSVREQLKQNTEKDAPKRAEPEKVKDKGGAEL